MAMLAEPRRKQRIGLNPRGKFYTEQEANFGKKLLQQMGWNTGEGLGIERQGISEAIRPKVQMTSNGLGYDPKTNPWMEHNRDFDELLLSLNTPKETSISDIEKKFNDSESPDSSMDNESKVPEKKLENRSKNSRARIHYHKFVKGKDLSHASSDDMKSILGTSASQFKIEDSSQDLPVLQFNETEITQQISPEGNTINKGSMVDYFKKKFDERRLAPVTPNQNVIIGKDEDNYLSPEENVSTSVRNDIVSSDSSRKKRKRNQESSHICEAENGKDLYDQCSVNFTGIRKEPEAVSSNSEEILKLEFKSKKHKKMRSDSGPNSAEYLEDLSTDVSSEIKMEKRNGSVPTNEESLELKTEPKKRKKRSDKAAVDLVECVDDISCIEVKMLDKKSNIFPSNEEQSGLEMKSKKKKKVSNISKDDDVTLIIDSSSVDIDNVKVSSIGTEMEDRSALPIDHAMGYNKLEMKTKKKKTSNLSGKEEADSLAELLQPKSEIMGIDTTRKTDAYSDDISLNDISVSKSKKKQEKAAVIREGVEPLNSMEETATAVFTEVVESNKNGDKSAPSTEVTLEHKLKFEMENFKNRKQLRREKCFASLKSAGEKFKGANVREITGYLSY